MIPDGWKSVQIGSLGSIQAGRQRSPHFVEGKQRPYLRVANVFDGFIDVSDVLEMNFTDAEYKIYKLEIGDILLNEGQSLELVGRPAKYQGNPPECCFQNTLIRFRSSNEIITDFALHMFRFLMYSGKFMSIATQTTSVAHLGVSRFAKLQIPLPPLAEQRKIAAILGAWDEAIAAAERLVAALRERKRGLMQRLLTGRVRFGGVRHMHSESNHEWKRIRLGGAFDRIQQPVPATVEHVLSITATVGFVDQREKFGRVIAGKNLERYILLRKGEFAYNKGNSNSYPQGCIYRLEEFEEGAVPNVYYCFRPKSAQIVSNFYKYYFEHGLLNSQLRGLINSGVRNDGLLNLSAEEFFGVEIWVPSPAEQEAIAQVLSCADQEIVLAQRNLDNLRRQKRGLMQRLLTGQVRVSVDDEDHR